MQQSSDALIELKEVSKTFYVNPVFGEQRTIRALRKVSLRLEPGKALALVGESGSGKSTVGRMIVRQYEPTSGQILYKGTDVGAFATKQELQAYQAAVQMVFQDPFSSLNPSHTIRHHLVRPLKIHSKSQDLETSLLDILASVELDPNTTLEKFPHELSGGQRQRVNLARALAVGAKVIVADEPTSMLDVSIRKSVLNLMKQLKEERGLAILYITHDVATAQYLADDTAVMFAGQIVEHGATRDVVGSPHHPYTRLLRASIPNPAVRLKPQTSSASDEIKTIRRQAAEDIAARTRISDTHFVANH